MTKAWFTNQLGQKVYLAQANLGRGGFFGTTLNVEKAARFKTEDGARRAGSKVTQGRCEIFTEAAE